MSIRATPLVGCGVGVGQGGVAGCAGMGWEEGRAGKGEVLGHRVLPGCRGGEAGGVPVVPPRMWSGGWVVAGGGWVVAGDRWVEAGGRWVVAGGDGLSQGIPPHLIPHPWVQ